MSKTTIDLFIHKMYRHTTYRLGPYHDGVGGQVFTATLNIVAFKALWNDNYATCGYLHGSVREDHVLLFAMLPLLSALSAAAAAAAVASKDPHNFNSGTSTDHNAFGETVVARH